MRGEIRGRSTRNVLSARHERRWGEMQGVMVCVCVCVRRDVGDEGEMGAR